jgi:hypothetical protein
VGFLIELDRFLQMLHRLFLPLRIPGLFRFRKGHKVGFIAEPQALGIFLLRRDAIIFPQLAREGHGMRARDLVADLGILRCRLVLGRKILNDALHRHFCRFHLHVHGVPNGKSQPQ